MVKTCPSGTATLNEWPMLLRPFCLIVFYSVFFFFLPDCIHLCAPRSSSPSCMPASSMSPASLLLLFSSLTLVAAAISADEQGGGSCSPRTCGNVTISHPFGFVPEQETDTKCGRLGFEVHCSNNTPYLGYYRRKYRFQVLDIFYGNSSLLVADVHKLDDFRNSSSKGCHVMTANTSSKVGQPFSVSSANLNLIFYNCTAETAAAAVRRDGGLVETKCSGGGTLVRVGGHYSDSGSYEEYSVEGCGATLVPVLGTSSGEANASSYEELISDGFLLTWQPPSGKLAHS